MGFDLPKLDTLHADLQLANLPLTALSPILALLAATHSVNTLLLEVGHGASRISQIVQALKGYSYLDQAPVQDVDVHEGLENTLIILRDRLAGIEIQREYAQDLPTIQAYGSELNQVFTNILHNAADALDGEGRIIIRTRKEDESVIVEIEDNGPGIPADIVGRIFEAFYTTKEPGKGTGLGLNISYNIIVHKHRGELSVRSEPGKTCFYVEIPTNFEADSGPSRRDGRKGVAAAYDDDEMLRSILQSINTIAVVGMSADPRKVSHTVPLYLHDHGYEIMPVNPRGGWLAGLRVYRDLLSLPKVPDAVLVFRPSKEVPGIVDQAIQIAARVVWMESGIRHDGAAQKARDAGLDVVMDTCMRTVHKRLLA